MSRLIELVKKNKLHIIIVRIIGKNKDSIHLHEKYRFTYVEILKEVRFKFNRYIDVYLIQLILK